MAALDFPPSPSIGQTYTANGLTYTWDGVSWDTTNATDLSNVTGTLAIANGGTGATSAPNARTNLGATTVGSNLFTLTNPSAITFPRFNADNSVSALSAADFRTAIGAGTGNGTVTSVGLALPVEFSITNSPVTSSGTLTGAWASQTAKYFFAAPNASSGTPTFRAIVASDIPTLNQDTTGNAATATTATNATNVAVTNDTTTNATMYPTWVTANTGNLPIKVTSTKLSFNPSTGILTVTGGVAGGSF